jgi:hypothetical protein
MLTSQTKLGRTFTLTLSIMTKFVASVFKSRHFSLSSRCVGYFRALEFTFSIALPYQFKSIVEQSVCYSSDFFLLALSMFFFPVFTFQHGDWVILISCNLFRCI